MVDVLYSLDAVVNFKRFLSGSTIYAFARCCAQCLNSLTSESSGERRICLSAQFSAELVKFDLQGHLLDFNEMVGRLVVTRPSLLGLVIYCGNCCIRCHRGSVICKFALLV